MSSLQLHVQLVHPRAVGGRLRRAPRGGGGSPQNLLGEAHGSVTNSEIDVSTATKPRSQEDFFFFSKRLKRSSHFLACLRTHTTSSIGRSASFTVLTRAAHMKLQERSFLPFPLSLWQRYAAFFFHSCASCHLPSISTAAELH